MIFNMVDVDIELFHETLSAVTIERNSRTAVIEVKHVLPPKFIVVLKQKVLKNLLLDYGLACVLNPPILRFRKTTISDIRFVFLFE
jgi:hypothetical protein